MMLDAPEVVESGLFRLHHLVQHLVKDLGLALAMLQRAVNLNFIENPEVHANLLFLRRYSNPPVRLRG